MIPYNPNVLTNAGTFDRKDGTGPNGASHCYTLLSMLHWICYTEEGRQKIREYTVDNTDNRAALKLICENYNIKDEELCNALANAHFKAAAWVKEWNSTTPNQKTMDELEKQYRFFMASVVWELWEDFAGHEFILAW